jgi:hypothetical protein
VLRLLGVTAKGRQQFLRAAFKIGNPGMDYIVDCRNQNEELCNRQLTVTMLKMKNFPAVHYNTWDDAEHIHNELQVFFLKRWWCFITLKVCDGNTDYKNVSLTKEGPALHFAELSQRAFAQTNLLNLDVLAASATVDAHPIPQVGEKLRDMFATTRASYNLLLTGLQVSPTLFCVNISTSCHLL